MTIADRAAVKRKTELFDPIFCKSIRLYFREYCNSTGIHGFRYFGERRTYFERVWWFIVFIIVLSGCGYCILQVYNKWHESPVIVSFDTMETRISSIPFPAVTICPQAKSMLKGYNHTDMLLKLAEKVPLTREESHRVQYMSMICNMQGQKIKRKLLSFSEDMFDFLLNVTRTGIFSSCSWMGQKFNCNKYFVPVIMDEGICYTFNMLDRDDIFRDTVVQYGNFGKNPERTNLTWNLDSGYSTQDLNTYPKRVKFPGVDYGLTVTMAAYNEDMDPTCTDSLQGFKVVLHTPMRIPRASDHHFIVPLNETVLGSIVPIKISTEGAVKRYKPHQRLCFFPEEKNLEYFKIYTQMNCGLECLTKFTLKNCKCVKFYMPRQNNTKVCGTWKQTCLAKNEKYFKTMGLKRSMEDLYNKKTKKTEQDMNNCSDNGTQPEAANFTEQSPDNHDKSYDKFLDCDCLPICSDLSYSVELSQSKWDWSNRYVLSKKQKVSTEKMHLSKLVLYFRTSQFVTSKRHELYGSTDFLANFGGLLGLFTGFSALSLMELLYFLSIRMFCNLRLYGKWYGPDN